MYIMKRLGWLFLLMMTSGTYHLGAQGPGVRLEEPPFQLVPDLPGAMETTRRARVVEVDTGDRSAVVSFFNNEYLPPLTVPMNWTGDVGTCTAGTTSQAYLDATIQLINFYRGMTGLADVSNSTGHNAGAQEAALMMSANGALNHDPPSDWLCWTASGDAAAGASNLALGIAGPGAIRLYINDPGGGNFFVGHRRWILYPRRNEFGTGSVGETTTAANALYVFTSTVSRPPTPARVAWPPEGYVPYQVVYARWSLSMNTSSSVSFASADVIMTEDASPVSLSVVSRTNTTSGDNTIVWEPSGLSFTPGAPDRTFVVTVSDIMVGGAPQTVIYDVVVIDPEVVNDLIFSDGFESGDLGEWSQSAP